MTASQPAPRKSSRNPSPRRPPEVDKYVDTFLNTVCDTTRRYILELLATPDEEGGMSLPEWRSGDIARTIGLSAATISEHLQILAANNLVSSRREGNVVYYRLRNHTLMEAFHTLIDALDGDYDSRQQRPL